MVSLGSEMPPNFTPANPNNWTMDPHAPERDGRVVWLIYEIGGFESIGHRYEDVLRQRYGRARPGRGRPIVQPGPDDDIFEVEPDEGSTLPAQDARCVWHGLLAMASRKFGSEENVSKLLRLLAKFPDLFEDSGGQWPVRTIVALLNVHFPPPEWTDHRVEDAKRRLTNWI
jgi:hypothetical protein